ncbi:hypothetical protein BDW62DRAFT_97685 [Aspergillus aurantiobrunneus]
MMAFELSIPSNSPFRGHESSEALSEVDRSSSPESSPSTISPQESKVRDWEDQGRYSPRAAVAGRLGELAIRGELPDRSLHQTTLLPFLQTNCFPKHSDLHGFRDMPESAPSAAIKRHSRRLDDHAPPTSDSAADAGSQPEVAKPPVNTSRQPSTSPRKKRNAPASTKATKSHSPSGAPPPPGVVVEDLLTWNDSEITGHNPTDPEDDGYGINGIGFKPTAAIAWARSQKRQKQVAEWKSREAREAREKRRERRIGNDLNKLRTVQSGSIQKKVKFDV